MTITRGEPFFFGGFANVEGKPGIADAPQERRQNLKLDTRIQSDSPARIKSARLLLSVIVDESVIIESGDIKGAQLSVSSVLMR